MKEISQTSNVVKQHRLLDFWKRFFLEEDITEQEEDITEEIMASDARLSAQDKKILEEAKQEVKKIENRQEEKRQQEGTQETKKQQRRKIAINNTELEHTEVSKVPTKTKQKGVEKEQEL